MNRLAVVLLLGALAVPAAALGQRGAPGDGSLVVANGRGLVIVTARGGLLGAVGAGRVIVESQSGPDATVVVSGADVQRQRGEAKAVYTGTNLRIRLGGSFRVRIVGVNINLSAVGRGTVVLDGSGAIDDGTYAFNDDDPLSVPDAPARFPLGLPPLLGLPTGRGQ